MIEGLIKIWERELDRAYAEVQRYSDQYYEGGSYLEADSDDYWEIPYIAEADDRLAVAEETFAQLTKFTS
tara:strand:- start:1064 stop:1273 length:210 start_codon:yes stop_codon:yes gene_type:complete